MDSGTRRLTLQVLFVALASVTTVIAVPFVTRPEIVWSEMNGLLLAGTLGMTAAVFCHAAVMIGPRNAGVLLVVAFGVSLGAEHTGVRWAIPFGYTYEYHAALGPKLLGTVPLFIPLSWFVLAYAPLVLLWRYDVRPGGRLSARRLVVKALFAALFLTAADFFLDPLATSVNAWTWQGGGPYLGIPTLNFVGWFLVGYVIYTAYLLLERPPSDVGWVHHRAVDAALVVVLIVYGGLSIAALLQRVGSAVPILVTVAVMGPYWLYWYVRERRARERTRSFPTGEG